ncbi:MAG: methyltransferase domain-containing protein [Dehalococcoidia bacterium]|nr:methyltransferase domain-containing protein [Dehalococcoidia bacterium]
MNKFKQKFWSVYEQVYDEWPQIRSGLPEGHFELLYLDNQKYRFESLANLIARQANNRSILDIGPSPFTIMLRRLFEDSAITTLDMTDMLGPLCWRHQIDFNLVDLSKQPMPWMDGSFDVVILGEVLEHVPCHPAPLLRECRRVLKPGGQLIVTTPNFAALENRLRLLAGRHVQEFWVENDIEGRIHFREYTKEELVRELNAVGYRIAGTRYERYWEKLGCFQNMLQNRLVARDSLPEKARIALLAAVYAVYSTITAVIPAFRRGISVTAQNPAEASFPLR